MILADVLTLLQAVPETGGHVELAVRVADVIAQQHTGPKVWLCEPKGSAQPNEHIGQHIQRREYRFVALALAEVAAGQTDADLLTVSATLEAACRDAVMGVEIAGYEAVQYVSDALVKAADGQMYTAVQFRTYHYLKKPT